LAPSSSYFRIDFVGSTDLLISTSKRHLGAKFILNILVCTTDIYSLRSQALSLKCWILDSNGWVSDEKYITQTPDLIVSTSPLLYY
jgi:hypothetical protein